MASDIFRLLEKDHHEVKSMMSKIAEGNGGSRRETFDKFKTELLAHAKSEEREFYTVLQRNEETSDKVEHSYEEHAQVEEGLQELSEMREGDAEWMDKFRELRDDLEHHIKEEEDELFPKAREILSGQAEEIGRRFEEAKQQYLETEAETPRRASQRSDDEERGRHGSDEDVSSLTRDELYDRARQLGIDGRSKMTKSELARAVRARG